jgi:hypothetical protein
MKINSSSAYGFDAFDRGRVEVIESSPWAYNVVVPAAYMNCASTMSCDFMEQDDVAYMRSKNIEPVKEAISIIPWFPLSFKRRLRRSDLSLLF